MAAGVASAAETTMGSEGKQIADIANLKAKAQKATDDNIIGLW